MKSLKYILLSLTLAAAVSAQAVDVPSVLKERSRAAKLPPTDSAILYHGTTITLYDDGRMDREEHLLRYLRSDNAWDDYGDPHLSYDAKRQTLTVHLSRVHTVDGRQIDTTPNGFNPITPFGLDLAPDFMPYQQMVVTHLGIENDAITELKYTISDKAPLYPWGWGEELFGGPEPILERVLVVRSPREIKVSEDNGAPAAKRSRDGNFTVYTWTMKDLPATNLSEAGAKPRISLPKVAFSSCPDWTTLAGEMNRRITPCAEQKKTLAKALLPLREIPNPEQRLDSLITFVKNRLVLKSYDDPGMQLSFRPADRTFATGYGSTADLAVLYLSALTALDFNPELFLGCASPVKVPGFSGKEKYLLHLTLPASECWLYPEEHRLSFRAPEKLTLTGVYPLASQRTLPAIAGSDNRLRLEISLKVNSDRSATGWIIIRSQGALAQYDKARTESAEKLVKDWLIGGDEVEKARVTTLDPLVVELRADLTYESLDDTLGNFLKLEMIWNSASVAGLLPDHLALNLPQRDLPLFLPHAGSFEIEAEVIYPAEWNAATLPKAQTLKAEGISLQRTVRAEKGMIRVSEKVDLTEAVIPTGNWNSWRSVVIAANKTHDRTILLDLGENKRASAK